MEENAYYKFLNFSWRILSRFRSSSALDRVLAAFSPFSLFAGVVLVREKNPGSEERSRRRPRAFTPFRTRESDSSTISSSLSSFSAALAADAAAANRCRAVGDRNRFVVVVEVVGGWIVDSLDTLSPLAAEAVELLESAADCSVDGEIAAVVDWVEGLGGCSPLVVVVVVWGVDFSVGWGEVVVVVVVVVCLSSFVDT